ncbi:sugar phosphate isomerase/epimerase family protein [Flavisolibacter nicotianae]|uniref:sugar phosphate isomerase/epimerase family protein n=1 Tax=Flavisolibacter nicotianae TaxID=2364882 RepID=UPI000EB23109|nr:sugar phosphate isomerase/epimerase [Flavisolibacter nicotianae]
MHTRRTFLKQTSLATTGLLLTNSSWFKTKELIGLQLYTVRNEIQKGLESTIAKVAGIGYNSVEVFGYDKGKFFGKTPEAFSALLKKHHLKTPSGHYMMIDFLTKGDREDLKRTVADAAKMGHEYIVVPFLVDNMRTSLDDYKRLAEKLNLAGEEAKKAGLKLLYHNHNFEFKDWGGGKTGFDIFRTETDASLVGFELDMYWIKRAGLDPITLIKANPGRIKLWHVKDMARKAAPTFTTDGEQLFTEVGTGIINYKEIFKHKKESGMEYFFIEQDQTKIPVYDSITKSFQYAKKSLV